MCKDSLTHALIGEFKNKTFQANYCMLSITNAWDISPKTNEVQLFLYKRKFHRNVFNDVIFFLWFFQYLTIRIYYFSIVKNFLEHCNTKHEICQISCKVGIIQNTDHLLNTTWKANKTLISPTVYIREMIDIDDGKIIDEQFDSSYLCLINVIRKL